MKRRVPVLLAAALGLAWFLVYLGTLSVNHEYDSLSYALALERGRPLYTLFHPHHLVFTWLARQWFVWAGVFGYSGRAMVPGQVFDCLAGAAGLSLFWLSLRRVTGDTLVSLLACLGMASTFGYWHASTILAVRVLNCVSLIGVFACVPFALGGTPAGLACLGLAHGFAILGHQTNALLAPALLVVLWLYLPGRWAQAPMRRWRQVGLYLACCAGLAGPVYLLAGLVVWARKTPASFFNWVFSYMGVDEWTRPKDNPLDQALFGWGNMFLGSVVPAPRVWGLARPAISACLAGTAWLSAAWLAARGWWQARGDWFFPVGLAAWLAVCGLDAWLGWLPPGGRAACASVVLLAAVLRGWRLGHSRSWVPVFCLLWLGAYVPFFFWWEPGNHEFWLSCLPPVFILLGFALADLRAALGRLYLGPAWQAMLLAGLLAANGLLFYSNLRGKVDFDSRVENNRYYNLMQSLTASMRSRDLLLLLGNNAVPMYLEYFQPQRRTLGIFNALKRNKEEPSLAFVELEARMRRELKSTRVFVLGEVLKGHPEDHEYLERNFSLDPGEVYRFASRFEFFGEKKSPAKKRVHVGEEAPEKAVYVFRLKGIKKP